jgi:hypothetical protein
LPDVAGNRALQVMVGCSRLDNVSSSVCRLQPKLAARKDDAPHWSTLSS